MIIERSCTNTVEQIFKDPTHPITQSQNELPPPKHNTRNSQITKANTSAYEDSCLQIVLRMKRDGYRDKYTNTKQRRKEATTVEYNLEVQKRNKQSKPQPAKRLHKGIIDTNDVMCPTCKRHFKKQGTVKLVYSKFWGTLSLTLL
jgi:ABC-type glutathione transport system ATPase component